MQQVMKKIVGTGLMALGLQAAWAFSLLGPVGNGDDAWQVTLIGYNPLGGFGPPFFVDPLSTGPKNLGEEYRRNTRVLYYAADASFLDYFGSNGVAAVDQAYAVLKNVFTNEAGQYLTNGVDSYSAGLTGFSLNTIEVNYQAQALYLYDLKSVTLSLMTEQLGLADAVRYVWALHNRHLPTGATCPAEDYTVVQRNFDIAASPLNQIQYSAYVNGELYSYFIYENCGAAGVSPPDADALEIPTDPLYNNPPVASGSGEDSLLRGEFYTGLTRDDVAGLRYLLSANNINYENPPAGALLLTTNLGPTQIITSSDLGALLRFAQINNPALIPGLFPGVVVLSSSNYFSVVCATNIIATIPNPNQYGAPYPPNGFGTLVPVSVVNCGYQQFFVTTFANIITNGNLTNNPNISLASPNITLSYSTNTVVTTLTTSLVPFTAPGQPYPPVVTPQTNVTTTTTTINVPSGEYLILPPGACGFNILAELALPPVLTTNATTSATNANGFVDTIITVTSFTPHQFLVQPINCVQSAPAPGLLEGIGQIQFVRANFDSLLGQFFQPITNTFTTVLIANSQATNQTFQRVVTTPDFLFSAADLSSGPDALLLNPLFARNINFNTANVYPGLAGPGTIGPSTTVTFNKVGPVYLNVGPNYLTGPNNPSNLSQLGAYFLWGSFDGSTNDPVVYPNGTSIANLAAEVLIQISPTSLPNGANGVAYPTTTLSVTGGQSPYTWLLASGSALPPGLNLSSGGVISGTPTQSGTFPFVIQMTDAANRTVDVNYSITIN
jgi:hypothetical protein